MRHRRKLCPVCHHQRPIGAQQHVDPAVQQVHHRRPSPSQPSHPGQHPPQRPDQRHQRRLQHQANRQVYHRRAAMPVQSHPHATSLPQQRQIHPPPPARRSAPQRRQGHRLKPRPLQRASHLRRLPRGIRSVLPMLQRAPATRAKQRAGGLAPLPRGRNDRSIAAPTLAPPAQRPGANRLARQRPRQIQRLAGRQDGDPVTIRTDPGD